MAQLERFKLQAVPWDSDKDPAGFNLWVETMGSLVRSTAHGSTLEDILDYKLRRKRVAAVATPSWILDDPDFGLGSAAAQSFSAQPGLTVSTNVVEAAEGEDAPAPVLQSTAARAAQTAGASPLENVRSGTMT